MGDSAQGIPSDTVGKYGVKDRAVAPRVETVLNSLIDYVAGLIRGNAAGPGGGGRGGGSVGGGRGCGF